MCIFMGACVFVCIMSLLYVTVSNFFSTGCLCVRILVC